MSVRLLNSIKMKTSAISSKSILNLGVILLFVTAFSCKQQNQLMKPASASNVQIQKKTNSFSMIKIVKKKTSAKTAKTSVEEADQVVVSKSNTDTKVTDQANKEDQVVIIADNKQSQTKTQNKEREIEIDTSEFDQILVDQTHEVEIDTSELELK